ncbi:hypothetical protein JTB14_010261 [Gonioctena quinquepunctata]|nr:hypothetical protein JTB14_010261 [Gonioctena quinquepunctata]
MQSKTIDDLRLIAFKFAKQIQINTTDEKAGCDWTQLSPLKKSEGISHARSQGWGEAATSENATSGFRAARVFPLNAGATPKYAFNGNIEAPVENEENYHIVITQLTQRWKSLVQVHQTLKYLHR